MQNNELKNKHLTLDDRIEIRECLAKGMTFKAIGKRIGKNQTTVSREVKLHLQPYTSGHTRLDEPCPLLFKAPFVCNGCDKKSKSSCRYRRQVYSAKKAQEEYAELLTEARSGVALSRESFYEAERIKRNTITASPRRRCWMSVSMRARRTAQDRVNSICFQTLTKRSIC